MLQPDRPLFRVAQRPGLEQSSGPVISVDDEVVSLVLTEDAVREIVRDRGERGLDHVFRDLRDRLAGGELGTDPHDLLTCDERNPRQDARFVQANGVRCVEFCQKVDD